MSNQPLEKMSRTTRSSRDAERRDAEPIRPKYSFDFGPRKNLPYIPPRPGFVQRWVRVAVRGESDAPNAQKAYGQYWKARDPETLSDSDQAAFVDGQIGNGEIRVRDNVLMERPQEAEDAYRDEITRMTEAQRGKVVQDMIDASYVQHGMQPRIEPETRASVERGKGRPVRVADDE